MLQLPVHCGYQSNDVHHLQAFWMLQSIIAGGVYFDEFAELSGWRAFAFSAGLTAAIAGAVGMGCASFVAEQHVMISYSILPGKRELQKGCASFAEQHAMVWCSLLPGVACCECSSVSASCVLFKQHRLY